MPVPPTNRACARCGQPQSRAHAPFCSAGCKDRDLLDWLDGHHVLPGDDALDKADDAD